MEKIVILELEGDFYTSGFRAILEIRSENDVQILKTKGYLPSAPGVADRLQKHWEESYRNLGLPGRIKAQKIIRKGLQNRQIVDCQKSAKALCNDFQKWLNAESFQSVDRRLRETLSRDEQIRFLIRTDDPHLPKLPWHEWDFFDRYPNAGIAMSAFESESRYFRQDTATATRLQPTEKNTVNLLAILGNSQGINLETDRRSLENLPDADVEFLVEPDRAQLNDRLWDRPWDILFFAGHSQTEGETGRIYINQTESLTVTELKYGLRKAIERGLQLAIFNSCDGLGLVHQLQNLHLPQTIVMGEPVPDRVAEVFLKYFLSAFSSGESLYLAQRQARERLQGLEDRFPCASWLPILYQNPNIAPPNWRSLQGYPVREESVTEVPHPSTSPSTPTPFFTQPNLGIRSLFLLSLAVMAMVMGFRFSGLLQPWELSAYDRTLRQRPPEAIDSRILVVEVTENDVNDLGGYPLSDETLVRTIDALQTHQPAAIGIDMHRYQPRGEGRQDLIARFGQHSNLFSVCAFGRGDRDYEPPPEFSPQQRIAQMGFSNFPVDFNHATEPPSGQNAIAEITSPVEECTIRRQLFSYDPNLASTPSSCQTPYSLSFQLAYRFLEQANVQPLQVTETDRWQLGSRVFHPLPARFGGYQNLNGMSYQVMLNYRAALPGQRVSLQQVLQGTVNPDWVKNRIVLIGYTAPVSRDRFETPQGKMPGVWIHAHTISYILSAVINDRPSIWVLPQWGHLQWGDGLWIWMWSLLAGGVAWMGRSRSPMILAGAISMLSWLLFQACAIALHLGGWLPLVPAVVAILVTAVAVVVLGRR